MVKILYLFNFCSYGEAMKSEQIKSKFGKLPGQEFYIAEIKNIFIQTNTISVAMYCLFGWPYGIRS